MVGTSKILTVSYGTFSCTLEGFDDSFNTMKAIAEYFRGLASEDRYFGAEPPAPDAEMLAKIAEREIARRVDATVDGDGIVLRAAEVSDQSGDKAIHDDASRAKVDADRKAAKKARKAEKAAAKAAKKAEAEAEAEAKANADAKSIADAKDAEDARDQAADALDIEADDEDSNDAVSETGVEDMPEDAPSSELAETDSQSDEANEAITVPDHPDADSVAAKLQRIRAVVGKGGTTDEAPSDDLTEQFLPETQAPDVADVEADVDAGVQDLVADLDAHEAEIEVQHEEDAAEPTPTETDDSTDMMSRVMARHSDVDTAEAEETPAEVAAEVEADVEAEDVPQPRARVVRMKRADFEKAIAENATEKAVEVEEEATDVAPDFALLDGADELDDYLEDSDFSDDMPLIEDVAEAVAQDDQDVADASAPQVDDEALDRLMSETDAQMQEPEGSRRRDAIAQLKAAVAAKEAARQVGEPENDGQEVENAFRNDLSDAVGPDAGAKPRPRPVVPAGQRTERPTPAPLKLVAEQRIDMEEARSRRDGPVVPRRVAARTDEAPKQLPAGSFAEFADNMGATELSDLLEAAAAYTAFVEGADEFSRPQILRRVRSVAADDFKREDELRSFAELINAGRFTKVRNGRFQVADDSRFNPERAAS